MKLSKQEFVPSILIADDDEYFRRSVLKSLQHLGSIFQASDEDQAIGMIGAQYFDIVIIDLNLKRKEAGFEILKEAKKKNIYTIMLTDNDRDDYIEKAYKIGCNHYLTKDQSESVLKFIVKERITELSDDLTPAVFQTAYVTQDENLINEIRSLRKRLTIDRALLILGETGVGKTKIAEIIHSFTCETEQKFVAINASTIPENLLESELFGHVKGAFTGALHDKKGFLSAANNGTLFIDEITSIPLSTQKKLLKCLEEKIFFPVGSTEAIKVKFRLITSTCDDIKKLVENGTFRLDLYFRINGITLTIPSLKERVSDIPLLIKHFMRQGSRQVPISKKAMELLKNYSWPGNIRELKSTVEDFSSQHFREITPELLPDNIRNNSPILQESTAGHFVTEQHLRYLSQHGLHKFIDKMLADVTIEFFNKNCHKSPQEFYTTAKISRAYFYKLMKNAEDFYAVKSEKYS